MKQKMFFLGLVLVFCTSIASAQFNIGIRAGIPISMNKFDLGSINIESSRPFNAGLTAELILPILGLGVEASALFEMEKVKGPNIANPGNMGYILVPINLKWKIGVPLIKFFAFAGPTLRIKIFGDDIELKDIVSIDPSVSLIDNLIQAKTTNWGFNVGVGAEIWKIQASIGYFHQFSDQFMVDTAKPIESIQSISNELSNDGAWVISLAFLF